jgi:hypothetical protein
MREEIIYKNSLEGRFITICGISLGLLLSSTLLFKAFDAFLTFRNQDLFAADGRIVSEFPTVYHVRTPGRGVIPINSRNFVLQLDSNNPHAKPIILVPPEILGYTQYNNLTKKALGETMRVYIDSNHPTQAYLEPTFYSRTIWTNAIFGFLSLSITVMLISQNMFKRNR